MVRVRASSMLGVALLCGACSKHDVGPSPSSTISFSVNLSAVSQTCRAVTTPGGTTQAKKSNGPTLVWQVVPNDCKEPGQLEIRDWMRYDVLPNGRCNTQRPGEARNPTQGKDEDQRDTYYRTNVLTNAVSGCYKYTVSYGRIVEDPELEIVE